MVEGAINHSKILERLEVFDFSMKAAVPNLEISLVQGLAEESGMFVKLLDCDGIKDD